MTRFWGRFAGIRFSFRHLLSILFFLPLLAGFVTEAEAEPNVIWSFSSANVIESDGSGDSLDIQVTEALTADLVISYTLSGTATPGTDYTIAGADHTARTGTFTIPSATARFTDVPFPVTIINDNIADSGETIIITITDGAGYGLVTPSTSTATMSIFEDTGDAAFSLTGNHWVGETLTVTRTQSDPDGDGSLTCVWNWSDQPGFAGTVISGETALTYTIHEDHVGEYIRCTVWYTDGSGIRERINLPWVGPILAEAPPPPPPPRRTPPPPPEPEPEPEPAPEPTPVTLSVEAGQVNEGQPVRATATLGQALDEEVRIPLTLMAITAEAQDFGALTEIVIPAHQTMGMAQLPTFADSDPDDETLSIMLDESKLPSSVRPGQPSQVEVTIRDVEPLQSVAGAWQSRFARTAAGHVLDGIAGRISATPTSGVQGQLAGYSIHTGRPDTATGILKPDARSLTMREFLSASSMSWSGESTHGAVGSVWAQGAWSGFDGKSGTTTLDGEVLTALLGLDQTHTTGRRGLVLSHSQGEGNYQSRSQGQIESTQTLLTPWLSREMNDRLTIWGALGYGTGELTIQRNGREDLTTDTRAGLIAFGSRGVLSQEPTDGYSLSLISDVLWFRTRADAVADGTELDATSAHDSRMRLGIEGHWSQIRKSGRIQTRLESALRHDGGDVERGLGIEVGGGVHWQDPQRGLDIEIRGRTLLVHHDEEIKEQGVSVSMGYDPSPIHQGFAFTIKQDWGVVSSGIEGLFQADAMGRTDSAASQRFTTQAGYRFKVRDGRYTAYPYLGHSLDTEERETSLGWRLSSVIGKSQRTLDVKAIRQEHDHQSTDHRLKVEAALRW